MTPILNDLDDIKNYLGIIPDMPLWVFGYASLMWHPDFPYDESDSAFLCGYHRRFCILSHVYRGTPEQPGVVMGLDRGGSCHGRAFKLAPSQIDEALESLWEREMRVMENAYRPCFKWLRTEQGAVPALTFLADPSHSHYIARQHDMDIPRMIAKSHGQRGSNLEYLERTVRQLQEAGVRDVRLEKLLEETLRLLTF